MKKLLTSFTFILTLTLLFGCSSKTENKDHESIKEGTISDDKQSNTIDTQALLEEDEKDVMSQFHTLISNSNLKEIIDFIDKNITSVSSDDASTMLIKLEELQKSYRFDLEEYEFLESNIQEQYRELDLAGVDYNVVEHLEGEIKELTEKTIDSGLKVEYVDGFYYPMMDYTIYSNYKVYANPDVKAYFSIMETEPAPISANHSSLSIDWPDVINRALITEDFIKNYPDSEYIMSVQLLHQRYIYITFYGLNHSPLFDQETNILNKEIKAIFETAIEDEDSEHSEYLSMIRLYMGVLAKSGYQLTEEVEQYRENKVGTQF